MTTATLAVASLFQNFSIKKFKIQDFAEQMLKNAMNTNPACKNAAYEYYKAVYKWIGDAILPQIEDKLKKQQIVSKPLKTKINQFFQKLYRRTSKKCSKR